MNKRGNEMPELARFYKIIIRMQYSDIGQHNKPHFHAFHGEYEASIGIDGELFSRFFSCKRVKISAGLGSYT